MSSLLPRRSAVRRLSCAALARSRRRLRSPAAASTTPPTIRFRRATTTTRYPIVVAAGADDPRRLSDRRRARPAVDRRTSAPSPQRYREFGDGRIAILAPAGERGRDARAIDQIRRALAGAGLRGYVAVGSYPDADATPRFAGQAGVPGPEGDGARRSAASGRPTSPRALDRRLEERRPTPISAAPPRSMLAAQVDDPRDLAQSARQRPRPTSRCGCGRSATCATARIPAPTGRSRITPIGQVGGGD